MGSVLSDNVTISITSISCALSGMLAHYSRTRFIQRPTLVVLHVTVSSSTSTLVVGSPANFVDVL